MNSFDKSKAASAAGATADTPVSFDWERLLLDFEEAWQSGVVPSIASLLPRLSDEAAARRCLEELIKIDLEYRWKCMASTATDELPARPLLEDYVRRYPLLGAIEALSRELIVEEYRVRRTWGDRPDLESYRARFPSHEEALTPLFASIDAELCKKNSKTTLQASGEVSVCSGFAPVGFEILEELGRGGMGVVYKARQLRLNRVVALKTIGSGQRANAEELARFRAEVQSAARIQHANVVQVHEVGAYEGRPFCVLEYVNGGSLARKLAGSPLEPNAAAHLLEILARAVQAVHDQGILHRDLKPGNVLLHLNHPEDAGKPLPELLNLSDCVPKISDFGLAKPTEATMLTHTGAVLGTPSYMAPEQAEGRIRDIGPAADVYGLGAILYELLTGRPPFRGISALETLDQVRNREPVSPRQLQPSVPRDVETICLKCLQKDPGKRYTSAGAMADDLERFRLHRPIQARPVGRWERGVKWARRRPTLAALFAVLVATFFAAFTGVAAYTVNLRAAQAETQHQRERSERNYRKSLDAIERMLVDIGAQRMQGVPGTEELQVEALGDAIRLYEELQADRDASDPELHDRLGHALTYLSHLQLELGRGEEAEANCRRGIAFLEDVVEEFPDVRSYRQHLASGRYFLGNILAARDQRDTAEQLYLTALNDWQSMEDSDSLSQARQMECYNGLAVVCGNFERCQDYHRRQLTLGEVLHKDKPGDWFTTNRLAQALYNVAHDCLLAGRKSEAEKMFLRCSSLLEPLLARAPHGHGEQAARLLTRATLAHCYNGLGAFYSGTNAEKSESFYKKAVALCEDTVRLYPQPPRWEELAVSYTNLASIYQLQHRTKEAETLYRKITPLRESLVREMPHSALNQLTLAETYLNLGLILGGGSQWKEGSALLQKGRDLMEPLYRAHPEDARYAVSLGGNCNNQALLIRNRGDLQEALPFHDRAVAVLLDAHRRNPTNTGCSHNCAMALGARAVTRMGLKDYKNALVDWELLMEVVGPVEAEKYRHYRVLTLVQMGEHRQAGEEIEKMLRRPNISGDERYNCVCVLSQLVTAVSKDKTLTREQRRHAENRHIARALSLLTQLRADGFFRDPAKQRLLDDDEDLAALRRRGEIKRWREKQ